MIHVSATMEKLVCLFLYRLHNLVVAMSCIRDAYSREAIEVLFPIEILYECSFSFRYCDGFDFLDKAGDQILLVSSENIFTSSQGLTFRSIPGIDLNSLAVLQVAKSFWPSDFGTGKEALRSTVPI